MLEGLLGLLRAARPLSGPAAVERPRCSCTARQKGSQRSMQGRREAQGGSRGGKEAMEGVE